MRGTIIERNTFTFIFCTVVIVKAVVVDVLKRQRLVTSLSPSYRQLSLFSSAVSCPLDTSKATGSPPTHSLFFPDKSLNYVW